MTIEEEPDEEDYTIESVTQEEYLNVREQYEERLVDYVDSVMQKGIDQDMVAFLIHSMDGVVAYYKKESESEICYGYEIGLRINREDYLK